ncbi:MAG: response regulator transcription factor [Oscillospiraceae bacterium]|jgi:DNA-binding response OmpR family regulator|nr:response regulator transcription factor [Oscillospiraceae bacterium]
MATILFAEDEATIREFVVVNLARAGYKVTAVSDGQEVIDEFEKNKGDFEVVILDIMMPNKDGVEVCKYIRKKDRVIGIIMLSAKAQDMDKVSGLMVGADDYLTKPFSPSELLARVDALCRRVVAAREQASGGHHYILKSGPFKLDLRQRRLFKDAELIDLTLIEYGMMLLFLSNKNTAFTRMQIMEAAWTNIHDKKDVDEKAVDVNVRRLRMKIEDTPSNPVYISTVWGVGYRWEELATR